MRFQVPLPRRLVLTRRERLLIEATDAEIGRRVTAAFRRHWKARDDAEAAREELLAQQRKTSSEYMASRPAQPWRRRLLDWWPGDRFDLTLAIIVIGCLGVCIWAGFFIGERAGEPTCRPAYHGGRDGDRRRVNGGIANLAQAPQVFGEQEVRRFARVAGLPDGELLSAHFLYGPAIKRGELLLPLGSGAGSRIVVAFACGAFVQQVFRPARHFQIPQEDA